MCVCATLILYISVGSVPFYLYIYFFKVAVTDIVYASSLCYVCLQMTICFTFRRAKWKESCGTSEMGSLKMQFVSGEVSCACSTVVLR